MEISRIVREILEKRGITGEKEIEEYLSMKPQLTYDPFLMKGMKPAVDMIRDHISKGSMSLSLTVHHDAKKPASSLVGVSVKHLLGEEVVGG